MDSKTQSSCGGRVHQPLPRSRWCSRRSRAIFGPIAPAGFRRRLMVTCDGAGASHDLIARLDKLAARPGYQRILKCGMA